MKERDNDVSVSIKGLKIIEQAGAMTQSSDRLNNFPARRKSGPEDPPPIHAMCAGRQDAADGPPTRCGLAAIVTPYSLERCDLCLSGVSSAHGQGPGMTHTAFSRRVKTHNQSDDGKPRFGRGNEVGDLLLLFPPISPISTTPLVCGSAMNSSRQSRILSPCTDRRQHRPSSTVPARRRRSARSPRWSGKPSER